MVKKSILAIAMLGLLATVSFGATFDPNTGQGTDTGQFKADNGWPMKCEFIPQIICKIPIKLKVGFFIEILDCGNDKKLIPINLVQVTCPAGQSFPCYSACTTFQVRSNFEAQISCRIDRTETAPGSGKYLLTQSFFGNNYKCYFVVGDTTPNTIIVPGTGATTTVKVCVDAWNVDLFLGGPKTNPKVGDLVILAMPTATPVCVDP